MGEATTCSVGEIAELLNLTPRRVQQLVQEGVIPKAARGRYDLAASVGAYVAHLQGQLGDGKAPHNLSAQRARLAAAQADKAEMELAARRGELVDVGRAVELLTKVVSAVRARVLALPADAVPRLKGKRRADEMRAVLQDLTDECLHEIAAIDPAGLAAGGPGEGPSKSPAPGGASPAPDDQRVGRRRKAPVRRGKRRPRKVEDG